MTKSIKSGGKGGRAAQRYGTSQNGAASPGKVSRAQQRYQRAPVQLKRGPIQAKNAGDAGDKSGGTDSVHDAAEAGFSGASWALPHLETIQQSFGKHDVSGVQAHVGGAAKTASARMGASAYASGNNVAFAATPTLHTAAHEAAHVVQQRGGVQLKGGVGQVGDPYERHADAVADKVVAGESAEALLSTYAGGSATSRGQVQRLAESEVDDAIGVKRAAQDDAQGTLREAEHKTRRVRSSLQICSNRLAAIESRLSGAQYRVATLEPELEEADERLTAAKQDHAVLGEALEATQRRESRQERRVERREASEQEATRLLAEHEAAQAKIEKYEARIGRIRAALVSKRQEQTALRSDATTNPKAQQQVSSLAGGIVTDKAALKKAKATLARLQDDASGSDGEVLGATAKSAASNRVKAAQKLETLQELASTQDGQHQAAAVEVKSARRAEKSTSRALGVAQHDAQAELVKRRIEIRSHTEQRSKVTRASQAQELAQTAYEDASRDLATYVIAAVTARVQELASMGLPQQVAFDLNARAQMQLGVMPANAADDAVRAWESLPREAVTGPTKTALDTYKADLVGRLKPWIYKKKLRAGRWHQIGRKRVLREKLKSAARLVVNAELHDLVVAEQQPESQAVYRESRAKRDAYSAVKPQVDEYLKHVGERIAEHAVQEQKQALATTALQSVTGGGDPLAALQDGDATAYAAGKLRAAALSEQLLEQSQDGGDVELGGPVPVVQDAEAEVGQFVTDHGLAEQVLEASSSEEAAGFIGTLLDSLIGDPGDGITLALKLKIPVIADPFGGFAAKMNLILELNGKAGRGTEGFVTAGVPAIASNPNHLEMQLGYAIGFSLEAGDASTLGFDVGVKYESFVRAGADSTDSAMAAFRYGVYRGTPIKALAAAWYGGLKKGRGPQGADYMLAEQRATAVEDTHFLGEGKERTFADHGRGIGVEASAAAKVDGATLGALGASGKVSGGAAHFHHYGATTNSDGEDVNTLDARPDTPKTQEEALERRSAMKHGAGSVRGNSFQAAVETEVAWGGQKFTISGAISGGGIKNWGVEVKAALSGQLAGGGPMDFIVTLATAIYELEHKLLSAIGNHFDQKEEFEARGMSKQQIKDKLAKRLLKRDLAQGVVNEGLVALSALGLAESGIAASFQFGLSGGTWTDRFDLISSMKVVTPDSLPVFSAELVKETRLISAEHQGKGRFAFRSPGVLAETSET